MTPEEREIIREFYAALLLEEESVNRDLASDRIGMAFRTAINELDWYVWNYRQQKELTTEQAENYIIISQGVARLIRLSLQMHGGFPVPALTFRRQNGPYREVLLLVSHLGIIQHGRRMADAAFAGICKVTRSAEGRYEFILPAEIANHGAVEDDVNDHFAKEYARIRNEFMQQAEGRNLQRVVNELHDENVFISLEHFIGYDADPFLDEHYFQIAWSDLRSEPGFDSFNELREFGGITYLKYTLAAAFIISLCRKHEVFCQRMVKKYPEIRMEDILTISADRAELITSLREALNLFGRKFLHYTTTTEDEAEQIYEIIAITPRNADLLDGAFPALPCIIEFANGGIVKCLAGRYRQMEFLLGALRRAYPREYDAHQQLREGSFQTAVEKLLGSSFPNLEMRRNIRLRKEGRELTDVDLAAIDLQHGHLLLIQLKFQDATHGDFRVEASRMGRFRDESVRWLDTVFLWLSSTDEQTLRSTFRVPRGMRINRIRKLILARHHAWSLRSVRLDDDTVFASWSQLINAVMLMEQRQGDFRTLNGLHAILRTYIVDAPDRYHSIEDPVEYILESLKFAVIQTDPAELSSSATSNGAS
ncbi:hypothetical protein SAMN05444339_1246 [Loktanella atrilutea]|uniref:Uncharacterized protein n=1 Tax=Loktanella atrilutea TaxID=366533 RepID=A0A1M5FS44_LOKAT|nr:hypothetical protein [Loktanella atrilutea]SHF94002.1 hypothetical protein SAMN05444339_1246 [Loktanella atrilutea]